MNRLLIRAFGIERLDAFVGHLLVDLGRARMARFGPRDTHETVHYLEALQAGDSTTCYERGECVLPMKPIWRDR